MGQQAEYPKEIDFFDARGTAAIGLLGAGKGFKEIAAHLEWLPRRASGFLQLCVTLKPVMSDNLAHTWRATHSKTKLQTEG